LVGYFGAEADAADVGFDLVVDRNFFWAWHGRVRCVSSQEGASGLGRLGVDDELFDIERGAGVTDVGGQVWEYAVEAMVAGDAQGVARWKGGDGLLGSP